MAKKKAAAPKKAAPKSAKKKPAKVWTSGRGKARAAQTKKRTAAPKQPTLFKGLRIRSLDKICEVISDTRAAMNQLRKEEQENKRTAHRLMRENKQMSWSAAGVELIRVPGDEKLRVNTAKETTTAPADEGEADPQADAADTDAEEIANAAEGASDNGDDTPGEDS